MEDPRPFTPPPTRSHLVYSEDKPQQLKLQQHPGLNKQLVNSVSQ